MTRSRGHSRAPSRAFLLSRVSYGDADLIVHLFTEDLGKVAAMARGARRASSRLSGALEPMHTLRVSLEERASSDLFQLRDVALDRPRLGLTQSLECLEVAGRALGWIRRTAPPRTPEPLPYRALDEFLDELDRREPSTEGAEFSAQSHLAAFGMRLVERFGWGLELGSCVACGKPCPAESVALLSPERGGLVCRSCGGGPIRVGPALRRELTLAARGELYAISAEETDPALRVVERALEAHMGIE